MRLVFTFFPWGHTSLARFFLIPKGCLGWEKSLKQNVDTLEGKRLEILLQNYLQKQRKSLVLKKAKTWFKTDKGIFTLND